MLPGYSTSADLPEPTYLLHEIYLSSLPTEEYFTAEERYVAISVLRATSADLPKPVYEDVRERSPSAEV